MHMPAKEVGLWVSAIAALAVVAVSAAAPNNATLKWTWSDNNSTLAVHDIFVVRDRVYALTTQRLFALDATSGHMLWTAPFPAPMECRHVDVLSGVLVCTGSQDLVAFDVSRNGSVVAHIAYPGCMIPLTPWSGGAVLNASDASIMFLCLSHGSAGWNSTLLNFDASRLALVTLAEFPGVSFDGVFFLPDRMIAYTSRTQATPPCPTAAAYTYAGKKEFNIDLHMDPRPLGNICPDLHLALSSDHAALGVASFGKTPAVYVHDTSSGTQKYPAAPIPSCPTQIFSRLYLLRGDSDYVAMLTGTYGVLGLSAPSGAVLYSMCHPSMDNEPINSVIGSDILRGGFFRPYTQLLDGVRGYTKWTTKLLDFGEHPWTWRVDTYSDYAFYFHISTCDAVSVADGRYVLHHQFNGTFSASTSKWDASVGLLVGGVMMDGNGRGPVATSVQALLLHDRDG